MGLVFAKITLGNPSEPKLLPMEVDAMADSGAAFLCIPPHVALQLHLTELHQREVTVANNARQLCPYVGPVHVRFQNRECMTGALVLGERVSLGALPMEDMDLLINPLRHEVAVNPASPNIPSALVM